MPLSSEQPLHLLTQAYGIDIMYNKVLFRYLDYVIFALILDRNKEQFCDLIAININFCFIKIFVLLLMVLINVR